MSTSAVKKHGYIVSQGDYRYDRSQDDYRYDRKITGIFIPKREKDYPGILSSHKFKHEDHAWLVWISWTTGNSFGRDPEPQIEAIGLFKALAAAIRSFKPDLDLGDESCHFSFLAADGQLFDYPYAPWLGYFERLENVGCDLIEILNED